MAVTIDEMTAEVTPPPSASASPSAGSSPTPPPEPKPRQICDQLERLERRAARLRAD